MVKALYTVSDIMEIYCVCEDTVYKHSSLRGRGLPSPSNLPDPMWRGSQLCWLPEKVDEHLKSLDGKPRPPQNARPKNGGRRDRKKPPEEN